jgi:hypothetical protein
MLDPGNLHAGVLKPARAAGLDWVGFHKLRHTCATELFRRGLNAKQVQVWLGHHSPAFTMATYLHLLSDELPDSPFGGEGGNQVGTRPTESHRDGERYSLAETGYVQEILVSAELGRDERRRIMIRVSGVRVPPPLSDRS